MESTVAAAVEIARCQMNLTVRSLMGPSSSLRLGTIIVSSFRSMVLNRPHWKAEDETVQVRSTADLLSSSTFFMAQMNGLRQHCSGNRFPRVDVISTEEWERTASPRVNVFVRG